MPSKMPQKNVKKRPAGSKVMVEISAGGIVFRRTPKGVRLAFIMDPFNKWAFAKGHVEKGESIIDAAVRETQEEMGIDKLRVIAPLGTIDFWFRDRYRPETKGVLIHKYVHYYLMQAPSRAFGRPQKKEKIRRIIWVPLRDAMRKSSYDDVRPILRKALAWFRRGDGRPAPVVSRPPEVVE